MSNAPSRLKPCPPTPNCVCSEHGGLGHGIEPLRIRGSAEEAWRVLLEVVADTPGFEIVTEEGDYLALKARTRLLRFVDDVELELHDDDGVIAMRSASRIGLSDFGANRRRLETLRRALAERGVVERA